MKYCSQCGGKVELCQIGHDPIPRHQCTQCKTIHYINPKIVVGCLPVWKDRILLCKRAIEPAYGKWTLPGGFLELNESVEEGALREAYEEAGIRPKIDRLFSIFSITHVGHIQMIFLCQMESNQHEAGVESLDVQFFQENEIPWDELAFPSIRYVIEKYLEDPNNTKALISSYDKRKD